MSEDPSTWLLTADGAAEMENLTYAVNVLNLLTVLRAPGTAQPAPTRREPPTGSPGSVLS
jgi:hypothetical protein